MLAALPAEALARPTDPATLGFTTTADVADPEPAAGLAGDRAEDAIRFAIGMRSHGWHLFAMGNPETDMRAAIETLLGADAASHAPAADWLYLGRFDHAGATRPRAVRLAAGLGRQVATDFDRMLADLRELLPALLLRPEFREQAQQIVHQVELRQREVFEQLGRAAEARGLRLLQTPNGFAFAPVRDGQVIDNDAFQALPEAERATITAAIAELTDQLMDHVHEMPAQQQAVMKAQRELVESHLGSALTVLMRPLRQRYQGWPELIAHLRDVESDLVRNAPSLLAMEAEAANPARQAAPWMPSVDRWHDRYRANVLVDHGEDAGAPVLYESNPTLENLLGRVEARHEFGVQTSDFTMIRAGALHRANGGWLLLDIDRVLGRPLAWEALKRALADGVVRIEAGGQLLGLTGVAALDPEPIPLRVQVVLLGSRQHYHLLNAWDPDFRALFKVVADFADHIERAPDSVALQGRWLAAIVRRERLPPFTAAAIARVIDHGIRATGDQQRLTTHLRTLTDVLLEAAAHAGPGVAQVDLAHVDTALAAATRRVDRVREDIHATIVRGTILVDVTGRRVGMVNGLSVLTVGEHSFGQPSRISATARIGRGEMLDIEREARLGGNLHRKAVLIVSAFIGQRYARLRPLSLAASLVFEQSYGGIEGDSATAAEVAALLSALTDVPLRQDIAITGSMNQHGEIQAIGGANEKIEGFFDICRARGGLTGQQGVAIPRDNCVHLMLRDDVVAAVRAGHFAIWPLATIDDALELLSGLPAGAADDDGCYPDGSFNARVCARLDEFARAAAAARDSTGPGMTRVSTGGGPLPAGSPPAGGDAP